MAFPNFNFIFVCEPVSFSFNVKIPKKASTLEKLIWKFKNRHVKNNRAKRRRMIREIGY